MGQAEHTGAFDSRAAFAPLARRRIVKRLAASATFPVLLLIAPAGYGKSVVLRQYLASLRERRSLFSLRAEHSTLLSFLRGFAEALRESAPHALASLAGAYERNRASPQCGIELARWMRAHLQSYVGTIALDDLHIADGDDEIARFLTALIEQSKDAIRWILVSRSVAGLPVGSWLAYGDADSPADEADLRFTLEEAKLAAGELGLSIRDDELKDLVDLTGGWPVAMSFALRTSTRSSDLRKVSLQTREMMYRFLAEQVYAELNPDERGLLEVATSLPSINIRVLERAGFDNALQIVERLRESTAFIHEDSPGTYQCHDLFREFLLHQSALSGKRSQRNAQERAARALEAGGDIEHAISSYAAIPSRSDLLRLLKAYGFDLLERAQSDIVAGAIDALDEGTRREDATVLALEGTLHAIAGRFARAESFLQRALQRASGDRDLVAMASLRLGTMVANRGEDATELLLRVGCDRQQSIGYRAEAMSLVAGQLAVRGDAQNAGRAVSLVEEMLDAVDSETVRAKALQRIGIAYHHLGKAERAFEVLKQSVDLADDLHTYNLSSRANAVLSNLVLHESDDVEQQLSYAQAAADAAVKAGDTFALQTALLQILSSEMRKGNSQESIVVERRINMLKPGEISTRYLTIFRATRLAWEGRFGEAHQLLSPCWKLTAFRFDRIATGGECALFLAMDGRRSESLEILREILKDIKAVESAGRFRFRLKAITAALCALAEAKNGRHTNAERILRSIEAQGDRVVISAAKIVGKVLATLRDGSLGGADLVREALSVLKAADYGDIARLFEAVEATLAANVVERGRPKILTRSEIEVLRFLEEGLAPKQIAERTGRSINTVRVHVANAITKLDSHGHAEAVRTARRLRLL